MSEVLRRLVSKAPAICWAPTFPASTHLLIDAWGAGDHTAVAKLGPPAITHLGKATYEMFLRDNMENKVCGFLECDATVSVSSSHMCCKRC